MKIFIDTEFIERPCTIDLLSIGLVTEDNRTLYLVNQDCNLDMASEWVTENVLKKMPEYCSEVNAIRSVQNVWPRKNIAFQVLQFIGSDIPEFWGYFPSYDWVVFCWLFGPMAKLPKDWPMYCRDLKQEMDRLGIEKIPIENKGIHNALTDAIWTKQAYEWLFKVR